MENDMWHCDFYTRQQLLKSWEDGNFQWIFFFNEFFLQKYWISKQILFILSFIHSEKNVSISMGEQIAPSQYFNRKYKIPSNVWTELYGIYISLKFYTFQVLSPWNGMFTVDAVTHYNNIFGFSHVKHKQNRREKKTPEFRATFSVKNELKSSS